MTNLKHIGRIKNNRRKVIVAYRVIPNSPDHCIVVTTENLMAEEHDSLMKLVESESGQSAYELAEIMARTRLPDGRIMLTAFHQQGRFSKFPTNAVEMTPNRNTTVLLSELNEAIAQQKGVTVEELAIKDTSVAKKISSEKSEKGVVKTSVNIDEPLSDEQLAAQYRSQADSLYKEAKRLRAQAEELSPTKKKSSKDQENA